MDVTDFVRAARGIRQLEGDSDAKLNPLPFSEQSEDDSEVGGGKTAGRIEVWGLTGWYLSLLMKTLGVPMR